jgi:hypothetical protein
MIVRWRMLDGLTGAYCFATSNRRAETVSRSSTRFRSFNFTVARRRVRNESRKQLLRSLCHLIHSTVEGLLICVGRPRKSAQFSNKLKGRCPDFFVRGRGFEIM